MREKLPLKEVFLVCDSAECKKLFTMEFRFFKYQFNKDNQRMFYCSKSCYHKANRRTDDPDYVRNRLITESIKDPEKGCWNWVKEVVEEYGSITVKGRTMQVHRASYMLFNGKLPHHSTGIKVRHTCNNNQCVNPAHLILGTSKQNSEDCKRAGRTAKGMKNGRSILSDDQVKEIRRLWKLNDGFKRKSRPYTTTKLGEIFNVASSTIFEIVKGTTWEHIKN